MGSKPLVSVIIIFLNAEKFIEEAILSVFNQIYDHWELLLVDDGSTDTSTKIALHYAEQNPEKVRYLEHEGHQNRGMSATRNLGIRHAKGEYVAFLDSDDVWLSPKLAQQVAIMESQPEAAMVYGQSQYWYGWTGKPEDSQRDFVPELGIQSNTLFQPPMLLARCYPLGSATAPCPSNLLLRREIIELIGGFEEVRGIYQLYEDQFFLTKVYLKAPVFVASECWDKHRIHPDSCEAVVTKAGQYHSVRLVFLNWLAEYLSEQGVTDAEVLKALQKALLPYRYPMLYHLSERTQHLLRQMKGIVNLTAQGILPVPIQDWLRTQWRWLRSQQGRREYIPPIGLVRFGDLRRVKPISLDWGYDRGSPIDRYYVEQFLSVHAKDIRGRVLEIEDDNYTRTFGGDRVTKSDVLHVKQGNPHATIVADLTCADNQIPSDTFDCVILTQTLQLIYDLRSAVKTVYRILKPGGVVLVSMPGITQVSHYNPDNVTNSWTHATDNWSDCWCWSFTAISAQQLFAEAFPAANVKVATYGNVLTAVSFLQGLAIQELRKKELDYFDPDYQVIITVRVVKPELAHND